jgi:DNA-binding SARP family transcriptional activator
MMQLEFYVLGSARVNGAGIPLAFKTKKSLRLLVYLLLEPGWHSRDALAACFWPDANEEDARASLRNALAFLRKTLAPAECLLVERERICFDFAAHFTLDLTVLEAGFKLAATPANLEVLADAAGALQGELLEGFTLPDAPEFEDWLEVRREAVRRQALVVLERLAQLQLEGGNLQASLEVAQRWLYLDVLSDAACRQVMQSALVFENPKLALEVFDAFKSRLERELGGAPEAQTLALAERARLAGRQPRVSKTHALSPEAPMVGRALEHTQLVEAFHANRTQVVLVEGEAGIGKTRLLEEFMAWARAQATVMHGRSFETGGRLPYQPMIELLRGWLEFETDPLECLSPTWMGELSLLLPEPARAHRGRKHRTLEVV